MIHGMGVVGVDRSFAAAPLRLRSSSLAKRRCHVESPAEALRHRGACAIPRKRFKLKHSTLKDIAEPEMMGSVVGSEDDRA
jgi:hypothetical protein